MKKVNLEKAAKLWAGVVVSGALIACGQSATSSGASDPSQTEVSDEDVTGEETQGEEAPSASALRVGEVTDGAVFQKLEVAWVGDSARVDLTFSGEGRPPVTEAKLSEDGKRIIVEIYGVRDIQADVPLVTGEGDVVLGQAREIAEGPIADIGRYFLGDDSGVRLEMALRESVTLDLKEAVEGRGVLLVVKKSSQE